MNNFYFLLKTVLTIILLFHIQKIGAFDWELYVEKYTDLKKAELNTWSKAFIHYLTFGIKEGRTSIEELPPTLSVPCSNHYTMMILLHLYDLDLMNEFIEQINYFMRINSSNSYQIMINIPVGSNIDKLFNNRIAKKKLASFFTMDKPIPADCLVHDTFCLRDNENYKKLDCIVRYMLNGLQCKSGSIQFLFSPNRGRDIGGFFLQLDQIFKQKIQFDYIVKVHSKRSSQDYKLWRKLNTSFLRTNINPLLQKYGSIYSNRISFNFCEKCIKKQEYSCSGFECVNCDFMAQLLDFFELPARNFKFCGGTMFIVSKVFTDFFKKYDPVKLFYMLNDEVSFAHAVDGKIEHAYERLFGYLIDYLGLNSYCLDYQP